MTRSIGLSLVVLVLMALAGLQLGTAQTPPTLDDRVTVLETRVAYLEATWGIPATATPEPATATHTAVPAPTETPAPHPTGTAVSNTATPHPTEAATAVPSATSTLIPSPVPSPIPPSATAVAASATPVPPTATPPVVTGQPCPAWYHERITAAGLDGKPYPTWHSAVDATTGCRFGHEHGDDPRTSLANPVMPAFGYIGRLVGDEEPHVGFKVFVQNAGSVNNDGRTLSHHARMVFHMGTGGPKRFTTRFHSLEYDFVQVGADKTGARHEVHVAGMADTGGVGSICASPRQGKTVMVLPNLCKTDSNYEIWSVELYVGDRVTVVTAFAVFDPITLMDPADPSRFLAMESYYPDRWPPYLSCKREAYSGPVYYYGDGGAGLSTFRTDAYGVASATGPLVQRVSRHRDGGVWMTTDNTQTQAKLGSNLCNSSPGLTRPN